MASPSFRFAKIVSARVERKHVFWIGEGYHHCARRTNAPSAPSARTFADMFRTTTFLAVFVALIASAQALPTGVTCANYAAATYCDSISAVATTSATGSAMCPLASDDLSATCSWDSSDGTCRSSSAADLAEASWMTAEQQTCGASGKTTEATCLPTTTCTWFKTGASSGRCGQNADAAIATLTGTSGATAIMIEFAKYNFISQTCRPLYKDAATCNANPLCTYRAVELACDASVNFHIANLNAAGCTTQAEAMATKRGTTVAAATAATASGAAGFSSGAVILSALVAALALVA
jgi:hypothetical protein